MRTELVETTLLMMQSFFDLLAFIEEKYGQPREDAIHGSVGLYARNRVESKKRNRLASIRSDNSIVRVYTEISDDNISQLIEIRLWTHESFAETLKLLAYNDGKTRAEILHESVNLYAEYMADLKKGYRLASIRSDNSIETIY
jgi:predicted DNA-binding protein